ncbi:hypothetical protein FisN_26Lh121 [Fistulifera solaris]|uniref:Uncharacterized protein n=1 Tax=Fistulifera solaris TaxID=1519565 RepID=A0A1Z5KD77_FISSO|nr:hypothetical protein FisN_26Lh121 [Fistulifera solaris]|eukprot:GAX24051.1 hypothetical protein FisN_26Lh121 [Fistulifera solaris]
MLYYYSSSLWFTAMIPLAVLYSVTCNGLWRPPTKMPLTTSIPAKGLAIVTGANTGIGFEAARALAREYQVILACRSLEKGQAAVQAIVHEFPQARVRAMPLDLTKRESIRSFAQSFNQDSIAILINNAGRNTDPPSEHNNILFQTNFVGHFDLTQQLMPAFQANARLVQVSSVMHHFAPYEEQWTDPQFWKQVAGASPMRDRYSLSKLAAILFSVQLNRLYGHHLRSIALNPGAVNSEIWRDFPIWIRKLFAYIYLTPRQAAQTLVAAAVGEFTQQDKLYLQPYQQPWSGVPFPAWEMLGPFVGHVVTPPRLRHDYREAAEALWTAMEELLRGEEQKEVVEDDSSSSIDAGSEL